MNTSVSRKDGKRSMHQAKLPALVLSTMAESRTCLLEQERQVLMGGHVTSKFVVKAVGNRVEQLSGFEWIQFAGIVIAGLELFEII